MQAGALDDSLAQCCNSCIPALCYQSCAMQVGALAASLLNDQVVLADESSGQTPISAVRLLVQLVLYALRQTCQGVAAEVPDADELEEGGGSSAAGPVHHTPPRLAGLHTFSTQEVPRVVHTVASAPKESPAYVPGHSVTVHGHAGTAHGHAVMGVGWGMGAIRLGASGHAGDQQQHQQERAAASAAPSKALRPTSSLGEVQGRCIES
eukprot:scaffold157715_cov21-Tisochrysis_lutea.AAC.1